MNGLDFPDQIHLEKIRADLWCGREYGRAAIMVGAGFSRNADQLSSSIPPFPLLQGLAETMYEALYPTRGLLTREQEIKRAQATFGPGVLKLAREYEAEFGRPALDELILRILPDNNYLPGRLHRLLLSLPWSDVFTTNYDTLLERTRVSIHDRKYDLVQTVHDIPGRMKPRIVKLHGGFPSHRPFIVTEDDYRLYPTQFAPFVNMVQQSIMENSFCLVGFSGDDPNFLYWSGWVRDNLSEAAPTIYLCGLLSLSAATRKVLQYRRIIPIDLSPLFPLNTWTDPDVRHSKALEWLFLNLMNGALPELKGWPETSGIMFEEPSQGLPEIPPVPKPLSGNGPHFADPRSFKLEDFSDLRNKWRLNRLEYPGWVVAPNENRETIWRFTQHWIDRIFASVSQMSFPENLLLLYELNWRLEVTLTPLFLNQVETIAAVLNQINPYPHLAEIKGASFLPENEKHAGLDWVEISKCWVELTFALAREAREDVDEKRFRFWMDRLKIVIPRQSELQARYYYEEALFCLFRLDQKGLTQALQSWPDMPDLPFWESKRAALLAELGRIDEAVRIAEAALSRIRSRLQPYKTDYVLLSQEGFVMMLLKAIGTSVRPFQTAGEKFRARWDKLDSFGCNPWREIELFTLKLAAPQPEATPPTEIETGFDAEKETVIRHGSPGVRIPDYMPAFGLLRFYEEGGIPIRCGIVNLFSDEAATAAKWVSPFAPLWALAVLLRTGQDKWIQENYDRVRLATIPQSAANLMYALCSEGLRQSIEVLSATPGAVGNHLGHRLISTLTELLSRLSFRTDGKQKRTIFDFGVRLYNLPVVRGDISLFKCSLPLLQRSIFAMPKDEMMNRIPILLSLQIPGEDGFENITHPDLWPEPFDYFELRLEIKGGIPPGMEWSTPINRLIRLTSTGSARLVRRRAAARLAGLHKHGLLSVSQQIEFAKALWSDTDPNTKLPANTDFYQFAFMGLPEVNPGEAKRLVRSFLLGSEIARMFSRTRLEDGKEQKTFTPGTMENRYLHELLGATKPLFPSVDEEEKLIDWSKEESLVLLKKFLCWWQDEKAELRMSKGGQLFDPADQLRSQFEDIINLMAKVVLPRIKDADVALKEPAGKLLSEMEQAGFCILAAVPMELFIDAQLFVEAASKIRGGLISNRELEARKAMAGLFFWLAHAHRGAIAAPPNDLLATLINKIKTRTQPALVNALGQMSAIIRTMPNVLNDGDIGELSIGLDYLLTETSFSNPSASEEKDGRRSMPISMIPDSRRYASALAFQIYFWCLRARKPISSPIQKWKEAAISDVLLEVRAEWENANNLKDEPDVS
jgi:hypothetical protein